MELKFTSNNDYAYSGGISFFRVDRKKNQQVGYPESCKETFSVRLWDSDINKKRDTSRLRIAIVSSQNELNAERTQAFLNQIEKEVGISKTRVWQIKGDLPRGMASVILIDFSFRWATTSPLLHLFLLLARNGSAHEEGKTWQKTLAKFRRAGAIRPGDTAQFIASREVIEEIISCKGKVLPTTKIAYNSLAAQKFQSGFGIVQYAYRRQQEKAAARVKEAFRE